MSSITEDAGVVYLLTCKVTGLQYVGKTWGYEKRMRGYRLGCGHGEIGIAIREHGWKSFSKTKIARGIETETALSKTERAFIALLNTVWPHGYNLTTGGGYGKHNTKTKAKMSESKRGEKSPNFGKPLSPETRKKISESMSGERNHNFGKSPSAETRKKLSASKRGERNYNFGKQRSPETRAKISEAVRGEKNGRFGKKASPETRKKISEANQGHVPWNKGKPWSPETRAKLRASHLGKQHSPETRAKMSASQKAQWARKRAAVKTATASLL